MIQGRNYLLAGKLNYSGATSPKNERIAVLPKIPSRCLYTIIIYCKSFYSTQQTTFTAPMDDSW